MERKEWKEKKQEKKNWEERIGKKEKKTGEGVFFSFLVSNDNSECFNRICIRQFRYVVII